MFVWGYRYGFLGRRSNASKRCTHNPSGTVDLCTACVRAVYSLCTFCAWVKTGSRRSLGKLLANKPFLQTMPRIEQQSVRNGRL